MAAASPKPPAGGPSWKELLEELRHREAKDHIFYRYLSIPEVQRRFVKEELRTVIPPSETITLVTVGGSRPGDVRNDIAFAYDFSLVSVEAVSNFDYWRSVVASKDYAFLANNRVNGHVTFDPELTKKLKTHVFIVNSGAAVKRETYVLYGNGPDSIPRIWPALEADVSDVVVAAHILQRGQGRPADAVVSQYIAFCDLERECVDQYKFTQKAAEAILREVRLRGLMPEVFSDRKVEVMIMDIFDEFETVLKKQVEDSNKALEEQKIESQKALDDQKKEIEKALNKQREAEDALAKQKEEEISNGVLTARSVAKKLHYTPEQAADFLYDNRPGFCSEVLKALRT